MTETPPQVVRSYLAELDSALVGTTDEVRREILTGVREQLIGVDAATAAHRIDELGDPAFIAAEARAEAPAMVQVSTLSPRWYTILAGLLVAFGGIIVPIAGWIVGLGLVWASRSWLRWEKWVATLVTPGLMALALAVSWAASLGPADGGSPLVGGLASWHIVLLLPLVINVGVGLWLIVRARSPK